MHACWFCQQARGLNPNAGGRSPRARMQVSANCLRVFHACLLLLPAGSRVKPERNLVYSEHVRGYPERVLVYPALVLVLSEHILAYSERVRTYPEGMLISSERVRIYSAGRLTRKARLEVNNLPAVTDEYGTQGFSLGLPGVKSDKLWVLFSRLWVEVWCTL